MTFKADDRRRKYTMLVAWHKFDRYERQAIAFMMLVEVSKVPFLTVGRVCDVLFKHQEMGYRYIPKWPVKNYRLRIERAATKEANKRRQRIKV